jgi:hypothetical protein
VAQVFGVCLLPATNEFAYDTVPAQGARWNPTGGASHTGALQALVPINCYFAPGGAKTDYSYSIDQLQAEHPECTTVAVVCSWFGNSTDASVCNIYPSTTYIEGAFKSEISGVWGATNWQCSGLTQAASSILIPISQQADGTFTYGGTPSDQSIVRCIQDLKARGLRVVFYPFILMDSTGEPWRGLITYAPDISSAATAAVNAFLGSASTSQFSQNPTDGTVGYSGAPNDWTYRRMILHYANLCVVAGGVDLFVLGSELRGLESLRGPAWTKAGTVDGGGHAVWDYPFVAGLVQLAADVRSIFDSAGFTKNLTTWKNLITYSPDWSVWNGYQHPGANGQWPHLDSLFASANIDVISFDNYLPLSDWTLNGGGLDCVNWRQPAPTTWPPSTATMSGLGLTGFPTIYSKPYLTGNIESGEQFNWFYTNGTNGAVGLDPFGSGQYCSVPQGDRLAQARNPYYANQQLLGRKQFRWWWNNTHKAVYDTGSGWAPQGPTTQWVAQSKPIVFVEYGFSTVDRCTNQPNVFYSPKSIESATPFWSEWESADGETLTPVRDDLLANLALQTIYDYWSTSAKVPVSSGGVPMILTAFCCAWNWDARPFPVFPLNNTVWGDTGGWRAGNWIGGKGPAIVPPAAPAPTGPGSYAVFPALIGEGWGVHYKPHFSTKVSAKVTGRETRAGAFASPLWDIELTFDVLRSGAAYGELQTVIGFIGANAGKLTPFLFAPPGGLGAFTGAALGTGDGSRTAFIVTRAIGGFAENVPALIGAPVVYANGAVVSASAYALSILPATITFSVAPAAAVVLTIDFGAAHLARFVDDDLDLEEILSGFWQSKSLKLETVRA